MSNQKEFIQRQHDEVKETLDRLREHQSDVEERLQSDPDSEKLKELLAESKEGIETLEPVLEEFDRADVDPEELINFSQTIEDWQIKEKEIASKLA